MNRKNLILSFIVFLLLLIAIPIKVNAGTRTDVSVRRAIVAGGAKVESSGQPAQMTFNNGTGTYRFWSYGGFWSAGEYWFSKYIDLDTMASRSYNSTYVGYMYFNGFKRTTTGSSNFRAYVSSDKSTWREVWNAGSVYATSPIDKSGNPTPSNFGTFRYIRAKIDSWTSSGDKSATIDSFETTITQVDNTAPYGNAPTIVSSNETSYTVRVTGVGDSISGISSVKFPTWTNANGQDDIVWHTGTNKGNGTWEFTINRSQHNNEFGKYITHVYAYDATWAGNNKYLGAVEITLADKTPPKVSSSISPTTWTNGNVTIKITSSDALTGVKSITLPNNTSISGSSTSYAVSANGSYTFQVFDNAGNKTTKTVSVTNIDKTKPTLTITGNPTSWTSGNITLTIKGADTQSGFKEIVLPNGTVVSGASTTYTVTANGSYTFKGRDNVGNEVSQTVSVTKIDKTKPTLTITGNPTSWTNGNVTLTIKGADGQSGFKEIVLPSGTVVSGSSTTYTVTANGSYTFKGRDNVGNEVSQTVSVTKIDKTKPTITVTGNPTAWTKNNVTLTIKGADTGGSSFKEIVLPNGSVVSGTSTTYSVTANGNYTFKVRDNAGNEVSTTVSVTKIDKTIPTLTITGNPKSWTNGNVTLTIKGADTQSGFKEIVLPSGTVVSGASTTYTVSSNGRYIFKGRDNVGNEVSTTISVTKIDKTKPTISITGNPTSWTKNNVTLTITGADTGGAGVKEIVLPSGTVVSGASTTYTVTANGSYIFKVRDNAGNETSQTVSVTKIDKTIPTISVTGNPTSWTNGNVTLTIKGADTQSGFKEIVLPNGTVVSGASTTYTVSSNGRYIFKGRDNVGNEVSTTISVTKIDKTKPTISITGNPTSWTKNNVTLTVSVADTGGAGVKEIVLPNNTVVSGSSTTYTVSTNGNYTFKVRDNAGNETSQTVSVTKIDKTIPTISVAGNPTSWTSGNVTLTIKGADTQSGFKEIVLPNGSVVSGDSTTYTVTANGSYTFKGRDNVGNEVTTTISVTKIDKTKPTISITGNPTSWTKNNITLTVSGADSQSGVKEIVLPNGSVVSGSSTTYVVSANGNYTFKIRDNVGNEVSQTVSVTKIDKTLPTLSITGNPTSWTSSNVTLTIKGADSQSGFKEIVLPNGSVVSGSSITYVVSANGSYTFKGRDNVGNEVTQTISVTKIDKTIPTLTITGNPTSWTSGNVTLTIKGADGQSGFKEIVLPNGSVVSGTSTTYTVSANGNYTFKGRDNVGNEVSTTVSVTKIDKTKPTISITGNPTAWTKNNITLTITGADSQSGVKEIVLPNNTVVSGSSTTYVVSANGNYTFKIRDNVGNEVTQTVSVTKIDKTLPTLSITGNPTSWTSSNVTLTIKGTDGQSGFKEIVLPNGSVVSGNSTTYTVSANGNYTFKGRDNVGNEVTQTISVTKIDKTLPSITITGNPTSWTSSNVTLTIKGSDSQSGVKEIVLPNNTIVSGSSTTYVVSANGNYTFKIRDNVGNEVTQTVSVTKIDKTIPTLTITGNPTSWTSGNVTLTIKGADGQSGFKEIVLPNGTVVSGASSTYTVTTNGNYTFKGRDNVGNEVTQTISVTKIDKTIPTLTITGNPTSWTSGNVTLTIKGADGQSGFKEIVLPNGSIVTGSSATYTVATNGNYTFKGRDNLGNEVTQTVSVTKIDKTLPSITITGNPTAWTNGNVTLNIKGSDGQSGFKEIVLPNGTVVSGTSTTYTVTANGSYTFKGRDNVGNEVTQTISVTKIDKTLPSITITGNPTAWTSGNVTLTIKGSDGQSGFKEIVLPNGSVVSGISTTYTVSANGNYTFKGRDNVGNEVSQTISVNKIDKTKPTLTITGNPTAWTNKDVILTIKGTDSQSGFKEIVLPNGSVVSGSSTTYTVSANGNYTFKGRDNVGNEVSQTISVTKIDKAKPINNSIKIELK